MCTFYSSLGNRLVVKLLNEFKNIVFRFDWGYNRKAGSIFQTLDSNGSPLKTKSWIEKTGWLEDSAKPFYLTNCKL